MKGISTIIATILMLLIVISLAGTVYVFFSGTLTGKTAKVIESLHARDNMETNIFNKFKYRILYSD